MVVVSNFPALFVEQAFWGRAMAIKHSKIASHAFLLGGLALGILNFGTSPKFVAATVIYYVVITDVLNARKENIELRISCKQVSTLNELNNKYV